ncbi:MAG: ATP-binding protein [Cyanobacteria bacterium SBLK]|nr:ATP-binding protein [Cyanobacteria bacterium SBLK]
MTVTLRASKQGLAIVDQARKEKGWTATAQIWCDTAQTSVGTLKRFRMRKAILEDAFKSICDAVGQNWEEIADRRPVETVELEIDFFSYDEGWIGRDDAVALLKNKIEESCRVLILVGITGIGKTALAERVAVELQETWLQGNWGNFHQENFDDEANSHDFGSVAARWLEKWGEVITSDDRKDTQRLMYRLLRHLKENRRLVLMDSLEKILQGNEEEGWSDFKDEWWVKFFKNLFSSDACLSRMILTSQDLPRQVEDAGTRYRNFWHVEPLMGLDEKERLSLFEKTGLELEEGSENRNYLERIGKAYEGHPLALRTIAGEIGSRPFYGNVAAYWGKFGMEIEEVEKAILEAEEKGITKGAGDRWQLDRYTRPLRRNVRSRLETTFDRLKDDVKSAYLLLCEGSVYRCAVPDRWWLFHLEDWDYEEDDRIKALETLRDRFLVEEVIKDNECQLRQHNLIRSVALERLKRLDDEDE